MNTDQAKGTVKALTSQVQGIAGTLLGNRAQQVFGARTQLPGKAVRLSGDFKEVANDAPSQR